MILSDRDGTPEVMDEPAWVLVYILDDDGTAFQYHEALVPDPCSDKPTPPTILFPYDRYAVANYAIATSTQNRDVDLEAYRTTSRLNSHFNSIYPLTPFANFVYSGLDFSAIGKTGSARYTSQTIWMGGMPMTVGNNNCGSGPGIDTPWRYCGTPAIDGSGRWHTHQGILGHYIDTSTIPSNSNIDSEGHITDEITLVAGSNLYGVSNRGMFVLRFRSLSLSGDVNGAKRIFAENCLDDNDPNVTACRGGIVGLAQYINLLNGKIRDITKLSEIEEFILNIGKEEVLPGIYLYPLQNVRAGDYIFIDSRLPELVPDKDGELSTDDHGFIVVGWGIISDCSVAADTDYVIDEDNRLDQYEENHLTLIYPPSKAFSVVPYVSDFPGPLGNRKQEPSPRPFYCSPYQPSYEEGRPSFNEGFTFGHGWFFFLMPNNIMIKTTIQDNQLYNSYIWKWTTNDGQPLP